MCVHQVSRSDLRKSWKIRARENYHDLAGAVVHQAASPESNEQGLNEMKADVIERIDASPH